VCEAHEHIAVKPLRLVAKATVALNHIVSAVLEHEHLPGFAVWKVQQ
jgi:hypothetical protein